MCKANSPYVLPGRRVLTDSRRHPRIRTRWPRRPALHELKLGDKRSISTPGRLGALPPTPLPPKFRKTSLKTVPNDGKCAEIFPSVEFPYVATPRGTGCPQTSFSFSRMSDVPDFFRSYPRLSLSGDCRRHTRLQ